MIVNLHNKNDPFRIAIIAAARHLSDEIIPLLPYYRDLLAIVSSEIGCIDKSDFMAYRRADSVRISIVSAIRWIESA